MKQEKKKTRKKQVFLFLFLFYSIHVPYLLYWCMWKQYKDYMNVTFLIYSFGSNKIHGTWAGSLKDWETGSAFGIITKDIVSLLLIKISFSWVTKEELSLTDCFGVGIVST